MMYDREAIARALQTFHYNGVVHWDEVGAGRKTFLREADAVIAVLPLLPEDSHPEPYSEWVNLAAGSESQAVYPILEDDEPTARRSGSGTP